MHGQTCAKEIKFFLYKVGVIHNVVKQINTNKTKF